MIDFLKIYYVEICQIILGLIGVAEIVVRLTPTEKDDGAVQRIGDVIKKFFDIIRIPNVKKKPPVT